MSATLKFMMGEFAAEFPCDRSYAKNHMWAQTVGNTTIRFGFSAYAVRLLQDIYFIDFIVDERATLQLRQEFGSIESKKAESGLYSPCDGTLIRWNSMVIEDPSVINVDKYGDGWLMEMEVKESELLNPDQYIEHLDKAWELAQRTIKGQANAE